MRLRSGRHHRNLNSPGSLLRHLPASRKIGQVSHSHSLVLCHHPLTRPRHRPDRRLRHLASLVQRMSHRPCNQEAPQAAHRSRKSR